MVITPRQIAILRPGSVQAVAPRSLLLNDVTNDRAECFKPFHNRKPPNAQRNGVQIGVRSLHPPNHIHSCPESGDYYRWYTGFPETGHAQKRRREKCNREGERKTGKDRRDILGENGWGDTLSAHKYPLETIVPRPCGRLRPSKGFPPLQQIPIRGCLPISCGPIQTVACPPYLF